MVNNIQTDISSLLDAHAPELHDNENVRNYVLSFLSDVESIQATTDGDMVELLSPFLGGNAKTFVSTVMPQVRSWNNNGANSTNESSGLRLTEEVGKISLKSDAADSDSSASSTSDGKKSKKVEKPSVAERRARRAARKAERKVNIKKQSPSRDNILDDDHASAWRECKDDHRLWGGRGQGGRGVRAAEIFVDNLHLPSVTLTFAGNTLLADSPLTITKGHRYGLIGRNGVGKSTLLSQLAQHNIPGMPHNMRVHLVQQQIVGSEKSALDVLLQADEDRTALLAEQEHCERQLEAGVDLEANAQRLGDIVAELDAIDADSAGDRAMDILKGFSFTQNMIEGPTFNLSGGWRMRLALARVLFVRSSDLWLLDEATNHLDLQGLDWLIKYLKQSNHTLICVSHDRAFLDAICTDIMVMQHQRISYHVGSYSDYEREIRDRAARDAQILDASERQRAKAVAFVQKQQAMANKKNADPNKQRQAKMIKDKKMERIGNFRDDGKRWQQFSLKKMDMSTVRMAQKVNVEADEPVIRVKLPNPLWPLGISGDSTLVRLEDVSFGYSKGNQYLLHDMTLNIGRTNKIAIVGRNGSGKSTLIKVITGEINDEARITGNRWTHPNLRIGHVNQYAVEELDAFADQTVLEHAEIFITGRAANSVTTNACGNIRQYLGSFGLGGVHAHRHIGKLSGGERMRLCFAKVFSDAPQLLILDESTNHVDLETLDALSKALDAFQGAIMMVSHNQSFLSGFCNELCVVGSDGRITISHNDTESFDELFSKFRCSAISSSVRSAQRLTNAAMAKQTMKQRAGARVNTGLL